MEASDAIWMLNASQKSRIYKSISKSRSKSKSYESNYSSKDGSPGP